MEQEPIIAFKDEGGKTRYTVASFGWGISSTNFELFRFYKAPDGHIITEPINSLYRTISVFPLTHAKEYLLRGYHPSKNTCTRGVIMSIEDIITPN